MSATIGKNADNGMTSITFDSTGRTVQFTPDESQDFDERLRLVKVQGKLHKEHIASEAVHALQLLGKAIEDGAPEEIAALWIGTGTGKDIVDRAILNGMIEKEEIPNPFGLYYINEDSASDEDRLKAIKVSATIKNIVDKLVENISKLEAVDDYPEILSNAAVEIRTLSEEHVGVGDTSTDEAIVEYFEKEIREALGAFGEDDEDLMENMTNDLYSEIH